MPPTFTLTRTGGTEAHGVPFIDASRGRRRHGRPTKCLLLLPPGWVHPRVCTQGHPLYEGWSCVHFTAYDEAGAVARGNRLLGEARQG